MTSLAALQRNFSRHVLDGDGAIVGAVIGDVHASAAQRLAIYADGYRLRLLEVLGDELAGLRALLGHTDFDRFARSYIDSAPSRHRNVRWYGDRLADFLSTQPPWCDRPALAEMAAFEWDLTLVFDAVDQLVATLSDLAALPPDRWPALQLRAVPSVRFRELRWNIPAIREAVDGTMPTPELQQYPVPQYWAIWRYEFGVRYRRLDLDEAALFERLKDGLTFADLCELLTHRYDDAAVAQRAIELLGRWTSDQWLAAR